MFVVVGQIVSLLKLRIGIAISASALAGMAAAQGSALSPGEAAAFALAVLGGAGAAGAFNHYYERDLDRHMSRTHGRPFATGVFSANRRWVVGFSVLLVASLALATASGGIVAAFYVFLGAFTYGVVYTVWLKRRTVWNIVIGGLAGSFAVLAGAAAVDPAPQAIPVILAIVLFLWTPPHFWSLAAARRVDYIAAGVPMLPIAAPERRWTLAVLLHTATLVSLSMLPVALGMGPIYGLAAFAGGGYFLWRSWQLHRGPSTRTALANFNASLLQLTLLIVGVATDAAIG
jgi:protoheme IX farnesyltransferase